MRGSQRVKYRIQDGITFHEDFVVPEAKHTKSAAFQIKSPDLILRLGFQVLPAVKLDDQTLLHANEIDYVATQRNLSTKLESAEITVAKALPKQLFDIRASSAQLSCACLSYSLSQEFPSP